MDLEVHDDWLRVSLGSGEHADFHFRWLRHNCDCDRHPLTHERTLCSSELPDDLRASEVSLADQTLFVRWFDGHESRYPIAWLREHAYAIDRPAVPPPLADVARVEFSAAGRSIAEIVALALDRVRQHGAAVVRRNAADPTQPEQATEPLIAAIEQLGLAVIPTHFGRIEDLRTDNTTNQNTDQLGYTDAPVDLHTDQPFLDQPPRYQVLQCIRPAVQGGANLLADALAVYRWLELDDPEAAELLATQPVRFDRRQRGFQRAIETPLVIREGERFMVRSSYFTLAPHRMPFARMRAFYRAHDRFVRLLRDPRHHVQVMLDAGDWLIYDNHRTLHARTGFSGARWLRGIYFDPR
jgi:alpha-ketoglutarate-dependent taurine dioxygenase